MEDEPFNGEYFKHLLASLTLNSRALIVELTGIAEKYPEDAAFMVEMIEERINKILPKYKLYSFYLMDSIIKNIGNPYNLLFAKNIFKLFTETYLIVDDTTTRQNLINLFKTWMTGKTTAGLDLFPQEMLLRIEKFIIRATSLGSASGAHQDGAQPHTSRITRDIVLREANYLLQYIIAMDEDLEKTMAKYERMHVDDEGSQSKKGASSNSGHVLDAHKIQILRSNRNNIIFEINSISEKAMSERKEDFDSRKEEHLRRLQEIRKVLDLQSEEQTAMSQIIFSAQQQRTEKLQVPLTLQPPQQLNVDLILGKDESFYAYVEEWGKPCVHNAAVFTEEAPVVVENTVLEEVAAPNPSELASSLGINIESFNFDEYNSSLSTADKDLDLDDDDGYDPESTILEEKHSPPTSPIHAHVHGKSSLKRPISGENRPVKRVRFDV